MVWKIGPFLHLTGATGNSATPNALASRRCANVAEGSAHAFERSDTAGRETKRLYRAPVDLVDATAAESAKRLPAALPLAVVGCLVPDVNCVQHATAHFPDAFPHSQGMSRGTVPV